MEVKHAVLGVLENDLLEVLGHRDRIDVGGGREGHLHILDHLQRGEALVDLQVRLYQNLCLVTDQNTF